MDKKKVCQDAQQNLSPGDYRQFNTYVDKYELYGFRYGENNGLIENRVAALKGTHSPDACVEMALFALKKIVHDYTNEQDAPEKKKLVWKLGGLLEIIANKNTELFTDLCKVCDKGSNVLLDKMTKETHHFRRLNFALERGNGPLACSALAAIAQYLEHSGDLVPEYLLNKLQPLFHENPHSMGKAKQDLLHDVKKQDPKNWDIIQSKIEKDWRFFNLMNIWGNNIAFWKEEDVENYLMSIGDIAFWKEMHVENCIKRDVENCIKSKPDYFPEYLENVVKNQYPNTHDRQAILVNYFGCLARDSKEDVQSNVLSAVDVIAKHDPEVFQKMMGDVYLDFQPYRMGTWTFLQQAILGAHVVRIVEDVLEHGAMGKEVNSALAQVIGFLNNDALVPLVRGHVLAQLRQIFPLAAFMHISHVVQTRNVPQAAKTKFSAYLYPNPSGEHAYGVMEVLHKDFPENLGLLQDMLYPPQPTQASLDNAGADGKESKSNP